MNQVKEKGKIEQQDIQIQSKNGEVKDVIFSTEIIELSGEQHIFSAGLASVLSA